MLCVIQIESSFERGMGHLYRSIDLANAFSKRGISSVFLTNSNYECLEVLKSKNFVFHHIDDIGYGIDKYFKNEI